MFGISDDAPMVDTMTEPRSFIRPFFYAGAFVQIADATSTYIALTFLPDSVREDNGLMAALMGTFGVAGGMLIKAGIGVFVMFWLASTAEKGRYRFAWMNKGVTFDTDSRFWFSVYEKTESQVRSMALFMMASALTLTAMVVGSNLRVIFMAQ